VNRESHNSESQMPIIFTGAPIQGGCNLKQRLKRAWSEGLEDMIALDSSSVGDALALQGLRAFRWRDPAHSYSLRDICSPGVVTA
jgi:hypothetical protein